MLKARDIVKRPDGRRYILIPNVFSYSVQFDSGKDPHPDHAGYMRIEDAKIEQLEKVGESS